MSNLSLNRNRPYVDVTDAMAQAQWAEKKWVWVKDKEEGFMSGYIVSENGDSVNIRMSNDTVNKGVSKGGSGDHRR